MQRKRRLPKELATYRATEKMVWLYIALNGEDIYSGRLLAEELGSVNTVMSAALTRLHKSGYLVQVIAPSGRRPGMYKAVGVPTVSLTDQS